MFRYIISIQAVGGRRIGGCPLITDEDIMWSERESEILVMTEGFDLVITRSEIDPEVD